MKTFNQYVNEETMPFAQTDKGFVGIDDPAVRDNINTLLDGITSKNFVTPYIGLERVSKVLANFHIFVPKYTFAGGDEGVTAFEINQFGPKIGMTDDGQVKTNDSSPYYLYFEYRAADDGMFGVFASVVTEDELDELMSDYEDEEDEEDEDEEMNEEKMTGAEMKKREEIVKSMKKNIAGFKKRYGKDAESVMYATATKQAMSEEETLDEEYEVKKLRTNDDGYPTHRVHYKRKPIGSITRDYTGWSYHYEPNDDGADGYSSKRQALAALKADHRYGMKVGVKEEEAPFEGGKKKSTPNPESRTRQLAKLAAKSAKKKAIKKVKEYGVDTEREKGESGKEMYEASAEKLGKYLEKVNKLSRSELKARGKNPSVAVGKIIKKFSGNPKHAKVAATEETQIDEALPLKYFALARKSAKKQPDVRKPFDDIVKNAVKSAKEKQKSKVATEETHDDDGWYAHKEIHGDKAVSKADWKKGIRMNRKGEKVQTKKLDEVSKKTLASYIKGAMHDVATRSAVTRGKARDAEEKKKNKDYMGARKDSEMADKMFKKSWKRREGIAKAADKLAKEETQIDEISKEKLSRYVNKAPQSAANMSRKSVVGGSPEEKKKFYNKIDAKIDRRLDYVGKAIDKLAKEETQIDELSKKTLANYAKKAKEDVRDMSMISVFGARSNKEKNKMYNRIGSKMDRRIDYHNKAMKKIEDNKD